ncbi:MAG TPA: sigma 54-interacting transcriptional regulator [Holophagaceae bacterium]|nr:sigma 54-interacting transcriptional regulator [Holophagaceae bacterium]
MPPRHCHPVRPLRALLLLCLWMLPVGSFAAEPARRRVVVIHSLPNDIPGLQELSTALNEGFAHLPGPPVDVIHEYTGLDRFADAEYEATLLGLYNLKYRTRPVDLLVAVGPTALDFVISRHFLPGVPLVSCYVPERLVVPARKQRPELAAAIPAINAPRTIDLMLALYPRTRTIHVVLGASDYERTQAQRGQAAFSRFSGRVGFRYLNDLTLEQIEGHVRGLGEEDLVLFGSMLQDPTGRDFTSTEPLARISAASRRPVFGVLAEDLGHGILGGELLSLELSGKATAELGARILAGDKASGLPLRMDTGVVPMFDWRQVQRWNLATRRLPEGSLVRFRPPSLWDTHGRAIGAGLAIIALQSFLVAGLVVQLRRRKRTERALSKAEVRYRTVADFTYDWEYWQRPDGGFEYLSPACAPVSGYAPQDFKDDPGLLRTLVDEGDRPAWERHQEAALQGEVLPPLEFRIRNRAGGLRWVEQSNNPVHLEDGTFGGTRGSLRDITDRKRGELELKVAYGEITALKDRLEAENTYYRERIQAQEPSSELLGASDALKYLLYRIRQVAPSGITVLIQGETGTGKELVAESIHKLGTRNDRPLVKVNCAALPPALAESELFGHERGAFTGAQGMRKGRFEVADKGSLFLDEVGELPPEVQAKLLRVLQDGEFQRVGGEKTLKVDVRVIAATNRDLQKEVAAGRFREDLWYRLNVFPITVPPLRDRKEDIPILAQSFVERACQAQGRSELGIPKAVLQALQAYAWPGNVRELQNVLERAVVTSEGTSLRLADPLLAGKPTPGPGIPKTLQDLERTHILQVLESTGWKLEGPRGAATLLGMKPSTLRNRMAKLEIERPQGA